MTASNTAFAVFSGFGIILSLIPLRWHLESWNVGTSMFMIWAALGCLVYFVDAIVWSRNTVNRAPVWCDIVARIQLGVGVALPAGSLCIMRSLHHITCAVNTSQAEKRRRMIIDLLITIGIPMVEMAAEYVVSGHRFSIIEDFGCFPATVNTPLTYVLVWSWPLTISVVSACYGALAIRAFWVRRKNIKNLISGSTYDRYWRLMALASTDFCFTIPLTIRLIVTKRLAGVFPWVSWAHIHSGYSHIVQIPRSVVNLRPLVASSYEVIRWTPVIAAFVAFAFLGLTSEARKNYRLLASTIAKSLGLALFTERAATTGSHVVDHSLHFVPPVSITQQTGSRRDSDLSSDKLSTKLNPEVQPVKRPTATTATCLSIDEVPRVPEPALDPDLVKRASVPDVSTPIYTGNALDRV